MILRQQDDMLKPMNNQITTIFKLSSQVRYVAVYANGILESQQRDGLGNASAGESDRYEELFINPTLITAASQRGNLDCGGMNYLIVRYGNFFQVVMPTANGYVSVCVAPEGNPIQIAAQLEGITGGPS
jgi:hypothetical protein